MDKILAVSQELSDKYPKYISLPEASLYALLGFLVVFLGIAFLILIVWAVGKFMQKDAPVAKKAFESENFKRMVKDIRRVMDEKKHMLFSSVGASGRLAIQLNGAWRDFWTSLAVKSPAKAFGKILGKTESPPMPITHKI